LTEAISFFQTDLPTFVDPANPTVVEVSDHFFRFATGFLYNSYGENSGMLLFAPPNVAGYPAYYQEPTWDQNWYTPGTIPTRFNLGAKFVRDWNSTPVLRTKIDTVAYANYLHGLGTIDVGDVDQVLDEVLYLFPQDISPDRRNLIRNGQYLQQL